MGSKLPSSTGHRSSNSLSVAASRTSMIEGAASRPLRGLRDRLACLSQLTACDTLLTVSVSEGTRPPRTTCRVRRRPRRRCLKTAPRLRCRSSVLLLRARLLVTFSW